MRELVKDLPRLGDGTAMIADPRNDEHLIIAGLHCAFILFHNRAVDHARANGSTTVAEAFAEARRLTTWHYHWIVLNEFLPQIVGQAMVDEVVQKGREFYTAETGEAFMPVEFQGACYRFGHSMVRPSYRANLNGDNGNAFFGFIFDPGQNSASSDPSDLRGGFCAPRRFVGWQTFFDFGIDARTGNFEVKHNKQIDTHLSTPLFTLPLGAIASHDAPTVLAQRNLLRHLTWSLPTGQAIAAAMGTPVLGKQSFRELKPYGFDKATPLWYYTLKEAELLAQGRHLGPMAGRLGRGADRPPADRPELVRAGAADLAARPPERWVGLPDTRLLDVRPSRSTQPRDRETGPETTAGPKARLFSYLPRRMPR